MINKVENLLTTAQKNKVKAIVREEVTRYLEYTAQEEVQKIVNQQVKGLRPELEKGVTVELKKQLPKLIKNAVDTIVRTTRGW